MAYTIVGLGNPGEEYDNSRHNTGRIVVEGIADSIDAPFMEDKKANALVAKGKIGRKGAVVLVLPETFMNNSGKAVAKFIKNKKEAEKLVVVYDDFSLPLGKIRISFNRSSGGHNGLESVIKTVKTEAFTRIRIGIAPENAKGLAKVPHGDDKVVKFILGKYKPDEIKIIKKISKNVIDAVEIILNEGREKAMSLFNGR
ncbi:MAG: aminoacyl-tRNA hydrolase [Patescibacteria group bacterium]|nr:aminoacyl-tRNA hydrolase [Patescibacteria group bacterium]